MTEAVQNSPVPVHGAKLWPLSIEAFHVLVEAGVIPKNTELLYGLLYTKMSKSPLHTAVLRHLMRLIQAACPAGYIVGSEQPITCVDSEPEPDIFVVQGKEDDFFRCHPCTAELVVEVCVSSHDYDRSKLRAYANAGVKECWLVLVPEKQIEIYKGPKDGQYATRLLEGPVGIVTSPSFPQLSIDLEDLFNK